MPDKFDATNVADIKANFPPAPQPIIGEPNLIGLVTLLQYMMRCAQTLKSTISPAMNLLYCALPPELYANYTDEAYPAGNYPFPGEVDDVPDYAMATSDNDRATIKAQHAKDYQTRENCVNMNTALVDVFLSLIPQTFQATYANQRIRTPNCIFRDAFHHFITKYGGTTPEDRNLNKQRMAADWHPSMGFETLTHQVNTGIFYANLCGHNVSDMEVVDIALRVIRKCGLYPEEYKIWASRDGTSADELTTWIAFIEFWDTAIQLVRDVSTPAGLHQYGMNIQQVTDDEASNRTYEESVASFGTAHAATQSTINNLTETNNLQANNMTAMQQQMNNMQQYMCQLAMNTQQQPPTQSYNNNRRSTNRNGGGGNRGRGAGNGGGNGGGGYYNNNNGGRNNNGGNNYNNNNNNGGSGGGFYGNNNNNASREANPIKRFENQNYCWSHGFDIEDDHCSSNCTKTRQGHMWNATRANPMNGCMKGKHKNVLPSTAGRPPARPRRGGNNFNGGGNGGGGGGYQQQQNQANNMFQQQMPMMQTNQQHMPMMPTQQMQMQNFMPQQGNATMNNMMPAQMMNNTMMPTQQQFGQQQFGQQQNYRMM